jgi:hypothetical protein
LENNVLLVSAGILKGLVGESAARAAELAAAGDDDGAVTWRRITNAIGQLANYTPSGLCTDGIVDSDP